MTTPCRCLAAIAAFGLVLSPAAPGLGAPAEKTPARKIVFLAGAPDGHGKGTHEYATDLQLLKACLDASPDVRGVRTEIHLNGWPKDANTLEDAAAIVVHSTGANRGKHPLLQGKRLERLGRLMKRGCGLVCLHYTLFMPNDRGGPELLEWIGGYDDYERKYSSHRVTTKDPPPAEPASPEHPVSRGWKAFTIPNEFYIRQRFRPNDRRLTPILTTMLPVNKPARQVIAWAVQRADGGRGVGFTGGHFHKNWRNDDLRKMMLNAILWTAKVPVPAGGVQSTVPAEGDWLVAEKGLRGWRTKGNWFFEPDGVLAIKPRPGERGWGRFDAYLWAEKAYGDFVFDLEFKLPKGGNSGVFVRVKDRGNPVRTGIEVQINDTHGKQRVGAHDCGGIIGTIGPSKNMAKPAGEWNRMIVTCRGTHLLVELNGEKIVDLQLDKSRAKDRPLSGYVGLQDHGLALWFRNVRVRELPAAKEAAQP